MTHVVFNTTPFDKPPHYIFYNAADALDRSSWAMGKGPKHKTTFIRAWRVKRGLSLDQLAIRVPMDKGNLSKVERDMVAMGANFGRREGADRRHG